MEIFCVTTLIAGLVLILFAFILPIFDNNFVYKFTPLFLWIAFSLEGVGLSLFMVISIVKMIKGG